MQEFGSGSHVHVDGVSVPPVVEQETDVSLGSQPTTHFGVQLVPSPMSEPSPHEKELETVGRVHAARPVTARDASRMGTRAFMSMKVEIVSDQRHRPTQSVARSPMMWCGGCERLVG